MSQYLKVGRLLPGDDDEIRIIRDGVGEIGTLTKADAILTCGWDCSQLYLMERWISPLQVQR